MKWVNAYPSAEALLRALDNGGEWHDIFAKAKDGEITSGEIQAAAGGKRTRVFLMLATWWLSEKERMFLAARLPIGHDRAQIFDRPALSDPTLLAEGLPHHADYFFEGALVPHRDRAELHSRTIYRPNNQAGSTSLGKLFSAWEVRESAVDKRPGPLVLLPGKAAVATERLRWAMRPVEFRSVKSEPLIYLEPMFVSELEVTEEDPPEQDDFLRSALTHQVR